MGEHRTRLLAALFSAGLLALAVPPRAAAQGHWTATTRTGVPAARASHVAVWTGSRMLIWGGTGTGYANAGGSYDPAANAWTAITTTGAPTANGVQTAVWTGSKMVVWGGTGGFSGSGGRYDPATNTWAGVATAGAPAAREGHTAVWTGSRMIVWGGKLASSGASTNTGGLYDPATNTWTTVTTSGAPAARYWHAAVWTGSKMIVWGGTSGSGSLNTGGIYDPAAKSWTATTTSSAPTARVFPTAVWARSKMVVWGGNDGNYVNTGGAYDPVGDSWVATSTSGAPSGRQYHTAVWTGSRMVVWGGAGVSLATTNTGGAYDPVAKAWTATTLTGAPIARLLHTAVWAASRMIVWGGRESGSTTVVTDTGGILDDPDLLAPAADFHTVTPCRVVDTRGANGPALAAGSTRNFAVSGGACTIPATAVAVSVNLTAVAAGAAGYLTLFPGDGPGPPVASNVNFSAGQTRGNNAIVLLATDGTGTIRVKNGSGGAVHFVLDVNGYFQ
jgi:hypothetical protein